MMPKQPVNGDAAPTDSSGDVSFPDNVKARLITRAADLAWKMFQAVNSLVPEGTLPHPGWAPGPIPKSRER
ncbi:MAG TPA: hypothetical protein VLL97_13180, partial [Acidobacteriota bacterium]|nr:hypothetical protein [Acidobacteriota bacterium]